MTKKLLTLLLVALFPATLFAEVRVPKFKSKTNVRRTQAQPIAPRTPAQGPITRGMQQGILRRMGVETSKARIPATRSNPRFEWGRKLREQRETFKLFIYSMKGYKEYKERLSFSKWVQVSRLEAAAFRESAEGFFSLKKGKPEHEFYFYDKHILFIFILIFLPRNCAISVLFMKKSFPSRTFSPRIWLLPMP